MTNATMEIVNVPFGNDMIPATIDEDKVVWSVVSQICSNLGLTKAQKDRQIQNIKSDVVLSKGASNLNTLTAGGKQECLCIQNDFLPLWLAKISITPTMQKNQPHVVEKLIRYQLEAKDVLAEYFGFKEKEKLAPVVQPTQLTTTVPDSVASAMMMMQVNTINAFKESTNVLLSDFMNAQKTTLSDVLTYCNSVTEQNRILSDNLQTSFDAIKDKQDQIDKLVNYILEHKNVKTNNVLAEEVDSVKRFILSDDSNKWKNDMQNKWESYYKLIDGCKSRSYHVIYKAMKDIGYDVEEYKTRLNNEYKCHNGYSISKINTCAFFDDLHKPFELAMDKCIYDYCTPAKDTPVKGGSKKYTHKSLIARLVPPKFRSKAEELVVHGAEKRLNFGKFYDDFFDAINLSREDIVGQVCAENKISTCSPAFAICYYDWLFDKFEKYVDERVNAECL